MIRQERVPHLLRWPTYLLRSIAIVAVALAAWAAYGVLRVGTLPEVDTFREMATFIVPLLAKRGLGLSAA